MGVVAYLALVIAIPALACGHQGQDWPPVAAWRTVRARKARGGRQAPTGAPQGVLRLPRDPRGAPSASQTPSRPGPSWARKDAA